MMTKYAFLATYNPYGDKNHPIDSLWTETELDRINNQLFGSIYKTDERREDMSVKRNWTDPVTGKEFGYDWGFDLSKGPSNEKPTYSFIMKHDRCVECINLGTHRCELCNPSIFDTGKYFIRRSNESNTTCGNEPNRKEYNKMFKHAIYPKYTIPTIKDVIFNDPATIVFWEDGTKTVVKVMEGDEFDPHDGLAMAMAKKALGDDYRKVFKKWTKSYYKKKAEEEKAALEAKTEMLKMQTAFDEAISTITKTFRKDDID